jgi:hypothetical protein
MAAQASPYGNTHTRIIKERNGSGFTHLSQFATETVSKTTQRIVQGAGFCPQLRFRWPPFIESVFANRDLI